MVVVSPEALASAASQVSRVGAALTAAHAEAAAVTTQVEAAAGDEVSAAITALFNGYGQDFQAAAARAEVFHQAVAQALNAASTSYADAEAAGASQLHSLDQDVLGAINAPTEALLGRPLIGNGVNGTAAHPNGQDGGLLWGNGGNGFSETGAHVVGGNGGSAGLFGYRSVFA